jgi:hypothetical protein
MRYASATPRGNKTRCESLRFSLKTFIRITDLICIVRATPKIKKFAHEGAKTSDPADHWSGSNTFFRIDSLRGWSIHLVGERNFLDLRFGE